MQNAYADQCLKRTQYDDQLWIWKCSKDKETILVYKQKKNV